RMVSSGCCLLATPGAFTSGGLVGFLQFSGRPGATFAHAGLMFLHLGPGDGFCLVSPLLTNVTEHSGNFVIAQGAFERGHHALVSLTFYLHRALQPVVNNSDRN